MAANEGFQSKMLSDKGSYVIGQFVSRLKDNIYKNKNNKFMNEILDDIQEDLHDAGKQLMVKTLNNKTKFIKFQVNRSKRLISTDSKYQHRTFTMGIDNENNENNEYKDIQNTLEMVEMSAKNDGYIDHNENDNNESNEIDGKKTLRYQMKKFMKDGNNADILYQMIDDIKNDDDEIISIENAKGIKRKKKTRTLATDKTKQSEVGKGVNIVYKE